jgi:hypothetical protein
MNTRKLFVAAAMLTLSTASHAWGGGPFSNGWGDGWGSGDFGFSMNASARGNGRGWADQSYGPYGYGPYGYAPYGYAPYGHAPTAYAPTQGQAEEPHKAAMEQREQMLEQQRAAMEARREAFERQVSMMRGLPVEPAPAEQK